MHQGQSTSFRYEQGLANAIQNLHQPFRYDDYDGDDDDGDVVVDDDDDGDDDDDDNDCNYILIWQCYSNYDHNETMTLQ